MGFKIIYGPTGRAREYSDLALNLYNGCGFGCKYCYAPTVMHTNRKVYCDTVTVRKNLLEKVEWDCNHYEFEGTRVLLCFTCDPYQDIDVEFQTTRKVLKIFNKYNINFSILTKGGMRAARDFDLYKEGDSFGSTLTFRDSDSSLLWEPGAALPKDRCKAIKKAKEYGIKTWVSLEPVIYPSDTWDFVSRLHDYIDLWKVGKWNYDKRASMIDWKWFGDEIETMFKMFNCNYYIKDDLRKEMGGESK